MNLPKLVSLTGEKGTKSIILRFLSTFALSFRVERGTPSRLESPESRVVIVSYSLTLERIRIWLLLSARSAINLNSWRQSLAYGCPLTQLAQAGYTPEQIQGVWNALTSSQQQLSSNANTPFVILSKDSKGNLGTPVFSSAISTASPLYQSYLQQQQNYLESPYNTYVVPALTSLGKGLKGFNQYVAQPVVEGVLNTPLPGSLQQGLSNLGLSGSQNSHTALSEYSSPQTHQVGQKSISTQQIPTTIGSLLYSLATLPSLSL